MRFLCLHGRGTNSNILESQLAPLSSRFSAQHSFDFLDAECPCPGAPGVAGIYPAPYLSWYKRGSPEEVQSAHDYLISAIEEDGPYDGVIAFSEGAALAASLLLCDQSELSEARFKIAILFNCVVPLVPVADLGQPLEEIVAGHVDSYHDLLFSNSQSAVEQTACLDQAFAFSPEGLRKISIPTIHVIGEKDPFAPSSEVVVNLCEQDLTQVLRHAGGHELPSVAALLDQCAEIIETAIILSGI
ncbi:serine hydrolase FSH [Aspergillus cavernicola]|uniref:Serine hydrolase FSH n=1 Tax=Aspergillus cavernicola TaxID=176166 RepID=A0ABR4I0Y9_9EURO